MSVKGSSFLQPCIIFDLSCICHCKEIYSPRGKSKYCLTPVIPSVQPMIKFNPAQASLLFFRVPLLLGWDPNSLLLLTQYCEAHGPFQQSGAAVLSHLVVADGKKGWSSKRDWETAAASLKTWAVMVQHCFPLLLNILRNRVFSFPLWATTELPNSLRHSQTPALVPYTPEINYCARGTKVSFWRAKTLLCCITAVHCLLLYTAISWTWTVPR